MDEDSKRDIPSREESHGEWSQITPTQWCVYCLGDFPVACFREHLARCRHWYSLLAKDFFVAADSADVVLSPTTSALAPNIPFALPTVNALLLPTVQAVPVNDWTIVRRRRLRKKKLSSGGNIVPRR